MTERERWATRMGLVLAMAGNAVGLGNFLRFPRQAALNGGGAFMIPYVVALILLGVPMVWLEWSMGRYGGQGGHRTTVGVFEEIWNNRLSKYIGSLGICIPLLFVIFYTCVESWTLAYAFFSLAKWYFGIADMGQMNTFLRSFQGVVESGFFSSPFTAIVFWIITIGLNALVLSRGISGGIEKLAKVAMPLLFLFAAILVVRVFFIGTPDPAHPENSVAAGFAYIWNPDFSRLADFGVWLAAAGQMFFTLSIGMGTIQCYSSYVGKDDDVALTGLSTASANEFAEVILGGSIAIPIAVAFFGIAMTQQIASQGSFDLGFVAMPIIFQKLPLGFIFAAMWFLLLFFAGITSSVALAQPFVAFLQNGFGIRRHVSAIVTAVIVFVFGLPVVFFLKHGYLDQYDFWIGTVALAIFAFIEAILFGWVYGGAGMWKELTRGAELRIPRIFYYIIKFVVPLYLGVLLIGWIWQDVTSPSSSLLLAGARLEDKPYMWMARATILVIIIAIIVLVRLASLRRKRGERVFL